MQKAIQRREWEEDGVVTWLELIELSQKENGGK